MNPRSATRDARLSAREARTLRRIEDAAVAEDPMLELRLGLPLTRGKRGVVRLRRRSKAVGRRVARRATWFIAFANLIVFAVAVALTDSLALASLSLVPGAFLLGAVVSRPPRLLVTSASLGQPSRLGEHPSSTVDSQSNETAVRHSPTSARHRRTTDHE